MNTFKNFESFNEYIGLERPIDNNIDVGVYPDKTKLKSESIYIDFYRVSFKTNYINPELPDYDPENPKPITAVFFNNPGSAYEWDLDDKFEGYYLHLSKDLIDKHRYLFQNYLEYGYHEALFLTKDEETEVINLYQFLIKHYRNNLENYNVLLASINLILNMVESYYRRQFKTDVKVYSPIVSEFQQLLRDYYQGPIEGIPTVHYFAEKMHLTPNYLGDVIKTYTHKSTIETIHEHVAERAKTLLKESTLSNTEIAFELGFDYPNYFAKFFKKQTQLTPKQFRAKFKLVD
ncbi:helix-turn-helix domain-containing protein [Aestuariibaculum sp. M13]|uniref:helix-turn-helix domain-containing protein n=1 Tax=Aestuariibaculum sp. M13 TaxID=2967132 RepID=UPI002159F0FB|nr:helix-turn-helix domain-containing protein [Aestuariibaculum sp. M13]MCR8667417.1 helix-turn-helix domain-containing protein [Aestuariibaculum sp. M13]